MILAVLYAICAAVQLHAGATNGGWSTELGALHYYFGIYVAMDALSALMMGIVK